MAEPLVILIDRARGDAAYEQIAAQIRDAVASGALEPGSALPGVRSLASDLGVNLNTVARAYRLLEEQGFVKIRDRSGVEVLTPAPEARPQARAALEEELRGLLARMRQAGLSPAEVWQLVAQRLDELGRA